MSKTTYPGKKWALDDTRQVDWIHREILAKLDWLQQFQLAKAASMLALMLDHR